MAIKERILLLDLDAFRGEKAFQVGFKVVALEFDPEMWLLAKATVREGDHSDLSSVAIYPNPGSGSLAVYIKDKRVDKVEVYSLLGQKLLSQDLYGRKNESISFTHHLSPGSYVIRVYSDDEVLSSKLLVL